MSEYFEIAYAAITNRLCFFTGTGFSKAVTENVAPSWQALLEAACDECDDPTALKANLFPKVGPNPLALEEAAQVVAIELDRKGININSLLADMVSKLKLSGDNKAVENFCKKQSFRVITTNYDKLMEEICGDEDCISVAPGTPVPRSSARVKVYHVHGSISTPASMAITSEDYFRFINTGSYFSKKLSTLLHENTVVIMGYSLGDTNLKAILSDYRGFAKTHVIGSNIFFVARGKVAKTIKDYYAFCYGIRVIDDVTVHQFFSNLQKSMKSAKTAADSIPTIRRVTAGTHTFTKEYIKLPNSFYEIVSSLSAVGISIDDNKAVSALADVVDRKREYTAESSAWEQYDHLADWLIYLASKLELKGTAIEEIFMNATLHSMTRMSKNAWGYSWQSFKAWDEKWENIIASNRVLIREFVQAHTSHPDALAIVAKL